MKIIRHATDLSHVDNKIGNKRHMPEYIIEDMESKTINTTFIEAAMLKQ